jgi:hypothetical protein
VHLIVLYVLLANIARLVLFKVLALLVLSVILVALFQHRCTMTHAVVFVHWDIIAWQARPRPRLALTAQ